MVLGYTINGVLSQLTNLGQLHLIIYYFQKRILTKTCYKTYNGNFLAIVEAFKIWQQYLEGGKHEVFIFKDHNNFSRFIDTKNLSSCQFW